MDEWNYHQQRLLEYRSFFSLKKRPWQMSRVGKRKKKEGILEYPPYPPRALNEWIIID